MHDSAAYLANAVSYIPKMFMKLVTGVNFIKLFFFANDKETKYVTAFVPGWPF
jgi:hypothetical protein